MNKMTLPAGLCTFCNQDFMHCNCDSFHPSSQMISYEGDWLFFDDLGDVWKLTPTQDYYMPLTISLKRRK